MPHYLIITPVRNEEEFLHSTISSVATQSIKPKAWIIVDDGSIDNTAAIAESAASTHSWITVLRRPDRGFRAPGSGVIAAFNQGYQAIQTKEWDFLVKLDGDLSFGPDYFAACLQRFENDAALGIGGGTICEQQDGGLAAEAPNDPVFHVRGATKIYRRSCWEAIGGLIEAPGWDTVDEYKANMLGWTTYTFPEINALHHRKAGEAQGTWKNWVKNGLANYVAGYHPLFMTFKCGSRLWHKPYIVASAGLMVGFVSGYVRRVPQVNDSDLIHYIRREQLRRLCLQPNLWQRKAPNRSAMQAQTSLVSK